MDFSNLFWWVRPQRRLTTGSQTTGRRHRNLAKTSGFVRFYSGGKPNCRTEVFREKRHIIRFVMKHQMLPLWGEIRSTSRTGPNRWGHHVKSYNDNLGVTQAVTVT